MLIWAKLITRWHAKIEIQRTEPGVSLIRRSEHYVFRPAVFTTSRWADWEYEHMRPNVSIKLFKLNVLWQSWMTQISTVQQVFCHYHHRNLIWNLNLSFHHHIHIEHLLLPAHLFRLLLFRWRSSRRSGIIPFILNHSVHSMTIPYFGAFIWLVSPFSFSNVGFNSFA